ncbi:zinc finger Ran-binding domain-containing protein 2 isoform X3 [Odontomachus brunneus]|uniref:zinc finger Ran-binding domain-containing protein 2 isoform X3 n=1 Tax=Odontomachus brunneus TaxID=486640 RepID=UPI0013F1B13C|nr:zinc finger Ran-binding domain-containing protein 2 isoform X3 [Odontomachus brunneus]
MDGGKVDDENQRSVNDGDWVCPDSHADDWQCSKCGNVNWARRQQCNMCNAPKFGEIEERTGYGGGYNDRGVVEYKERRDEDDEYDEFGRRKKKRKLENRSDDDSKDSKYSSPSRSKSKDKDERNEVDDDEQAEENEDEEEDDEEDGDLSKYDLSEWDDFAPAKKSTNGSAISSEAQRSRNGDDWRDSGTSNQ